MPTTQTTPAPSAYAAEAKQRDEALAMVAASVARWTAEAQGHEDGAGLLFRRADWVEEQLKRLYCGARHDRIPSALRGLTAVDLTCAMMDLRAAASALRVAA